MNSRWSEQAARAAVERWGPGSGEDFALRLYSARLIGEEPALVLHGGGNVSLKRPHRTLLGDTIEALHIKASGHDLAVIEADGMPGVDLAHLRKLRSLERLTDEEMVNEIRTHLLDAAAPTPSIETLLHAFLPHRYVDHSHADAVLVLTNQPNGQELIRATLGERVAIVPYLRPGLELAKAVADAADASPQIMGIVLLCHGLVSFGPDARTSYERHIELVAQCEQFAAQRRGKRSLTASYVGQSPPAELAARVAPVLRGLLAVPTGDEDHPYRRGVMEWRATDPDLSFVNSKEASRLCKTGSLTTDHLIRTKPWPLFIPAPNYSDAAALARQLREAVDGYRAEYSAYITAHGGSPSDLDLSPCVILLPGAGIFCWGPSKRDARIAADITQHTLVTKSQAELIGAYTSLAPAHLYEMEHRGLQRAKLEPSCGQPLEGQVVAISGGAGAIGTAVAECCIVAGAHVALTDLNEGRLAQAVARLEHTHGKDRIMGVQMDVTDADSVARGFDEIVRAYGGVDVVVPNAGIAHVSPIAELTAADFRRVMEVNAVGYLLFMQAGVRIMQTQGLGGHVIINASKNVFAPGKDFGAYSASKAAGHQLGKVAAIELAPHGIRVNMINADAIFGDDATPSGLWQQVGPDRARGRDLKPDELPEYYRGRSLLKTQVLGRHVGNAVVFFASNATPTTGATLPVDGGIAEAFPR